MYVYVHLTRNNPASLLPIQVYRRMFVADKRVRPYYKGDTSFKQKNSKNKKHGIKSIYQLEWRFK
jgi:serine/threonine-protein kinase RIO1